MTPLMTATSLGRQFVLGGGFLPAGKGSQRLTALDDVSLHIGKGEIVGVVGRIRLREVDTRPGSGAAGRSLAAGQATNTKATTSPRCRPRAFNGTLFVGAIQMVFQDPSSALDRRWRALDAIAEPLVLLEDAQHNLEGRAIRGRGRR